MVTKLTTGDTVKVLLGKDRGKTAKILAVLPRKGRAIVEGVQMVKKHVRPRRAGEKGQRVAVAAPIDLSNLQLVCPSCQRAVRVKIVRTPNQQRQRVCRKCNAVIESRT